MGFLKHIHSNLDIQAFPGARFEITGEVPAPQCSEAKIEGEHGETSMGGNGLIDTGAFVGFDLTDKILHVTSPEENKGDYTIIGNTDDQCICLPVFPITWNNNVYFITDGGELVLTRNVKSFAEFIHAAGYAYTIKGRKLYTDMPTAQLKDACTVIFDPLT